MNKKQVKSTKKRHRRLNLKRVFLLALVICLSFLLGKELLKINIDNIVIEGNESISDSKIIKLAELNSDTPYLGFSSKGLCNKIMSDPHINTCEIKREFNFKIRIIVTENKPLFFYSNTNKIVLSNGNSVSESNTYGVPTLINFVPEKILSKFISGLALINSDIIHSISEIEYKRTTVDAERFMLVMKDGNIVYVNNRNIDVLGNYEKIYASIGDKKGYFNFDSDYNYFFEEFDRSDE